MKISEEIQQGMVAAYLSGDTAQVAAAKFGYTKHSACRALKRAGVSCRNSSEVQRKHRLDQDYFAEVTTPEKAYWLGFIAADGNVHKNLFQIDLKLLDRGHLEKMKLAFGSSHPVKDRFNKTKKVWQSRFAISNVRFVAALKKAGVAERKSFDAVAWVGHEALMPHYWRGVIDGDGSIFRLKDGRWGVSLSGSENMCQSFLKWVKRSIDTEAAVRDGHGKIRQLSFVGINLVQCIVGKLLYSDDEVALGRKLLLSKCVLAQTPKRGRHEHRGKSTRKQETGGKLEGAQGF